jgi:hypothetical protein
MEHLLEVPLAFVRIVFTVLANESGTSYGHHNYR